MTKVESADLVVVGCGPAGATAAREAARRGIETVVLEKDSAIGSKRVCAAGLRPGFCREFDLPSTIVHCDTPRLALFDARGREHELSFGPGHTTTREELDGTIAAMARREGAEIRAQMLFRSIHRDGPRTIVEYADLQRGTRERIAARNVFVAAGATARLDDAPFGRLAMHDWRAGLMTTLQYRVYLDQPADPIAYRTLELHYYVGRNGRQIIGWMFPKRDHLAIGLGTLGKMNGEMLRGELERFAAGVRRRLYPAVRELNVKVEGHLLYGGAPRPVVGDNGVLVGGTAAGLVDATNGEGIFEAAMSGRLAADAVARAGGDPAVATERYASSLANRFTRRLAHRATIMRFLERRPARYGLLFEQLARTPRFAEVLQREGCERTMSDRLYLYLQGLRFGIRALA